MSESEAEWPEHASEFAGFRIHLGDREAHGSHAIDVALVVVLLELLVVATQCNQTLGVLNTGGEGTTLGINEVAGAVAGGAVGAGKIGAGGQRRTVSGGVGDLLEKVKGNSSPPGTKTVIGWKSIPPFSWN